MYTHRHKSIENRGSPETSIYIYIHTCIHTYAYINIYIHTPAQKYWESWLSGAQQPIHRCWVLPPGEISRQLRHPHPQASVCVTWLIHMCGVTHSYVWHDSFICVTWLINMCHMTHSHVWHNSFICVTWLIHMCDMIPSHVWHDPFTCMTWPIHMCDMAHSFVWHDSLLLPPWEISRFHLRASVCVS